ncbi:MAG: hypothetical protein KBG67_04270 [Candidatus Atribacteria bacterium]|nr:hypothetical protein [Candidatus Atribacteria bacterium]
MGGKALSLPSLYQRIQKKSQGNIIASAVVNLNFSGEPLLARVVLV